MVETNTHMQEDLNRVRAIIDVIESQSIGEDFWMIEEYEELKSKVKPKIVAAGKELSDVAKIFRVFWEKHQDSGRTIFTKSLNVYLDALKFDP
jgi:hypothetical protein